MFNKMLWTGVHKLLAVECTTAHFNIYLFFFTGLRGLTGTSRIRPADHAHDMGASVFTQNGGGGALPQAQMPFDERTTSKMVQAVTKATVTQITTLHIHGEQKSTTRHTSCRTLWSVHNVLCLPQRLFYPKVHESIHSSLSIRYVLLPLTRTSSTKAMTRILKMNSNVGQGFILSQYNYFRRKTPQNQDHHKLLFQLTQEFWFVVCS